ncbi:ricin-type beta-trefoil lectin domain protein [Actinospica acidiphila]|uniref:Ricin-type beta-trefoil lectin domain protein n=1 Tax=Actinospica acidiphila TaxID=304899 RepID=A0A9X5CQZ2_9ACTN|nr:ricin-type beta-trefoil lectin domain protein [Actinospica acidiphila]
MTRPTQQPPASPAARTESGPHGERTSSTGPRTSTSADERTESAVAADSAAGTGTHVAAEPSSGPGSGGGAEPAPAAKPDFEAAPASEAEALEEKAEAAAPATASGARTATDTDVGGASVATSRLPMLVRTITATAIDKPDDAVKPVGRPGRAVLAGAAIGGSLLVAVPFLLLGADDDKEERASTTAATVLGGDKENETGDFAVSSPEPHDSADKKETQKPKAVPGSTPDAESGKNDGPDKAAEDAAKRAEAQKKAEAEKARERAAAAENSSNDTSRKAEGNAPAGPALSFPVSFHSHLSGLCIDVPGSDFSDGKALWMWPCNNADAQKFQFASDGTLRTQGLCMDVAGANFTKGTTIQLARCTGVAAQQFALNEAHDLVNTVVGMCVEIEGHDRNAKARVQLWTCTGLDNQKWSV